ncbi:MAG: 16S rRNA (guanine(966)-N(2))-methyltransferase RsmD [Thermosipho sp. (in: Bacteria)]|nr:16S rRNA (guanine(966)-N(2))-methyltransferase RsmD [Thermosipho sp. (in: thermotogales)]
MLLIETGIYKGRRLEMVPDKRTRYTPGKIRMALINMFDFNNKKVVDICAGSGIVGFEFLSNGAKSVHFVETSNKAIRTIKINSQILNVTDKIKIIKRDARIFLRTSKEKYDIVFTDPPFHLGIVNELINNIHKVVSSEGIIIVEHSKKEKLTIPKTLQLITTKKYGDIHIEIFKLNNMS